MVERSSQRSGQLLINFPPSDIQFYATTLDDLTEFEIVFYAAMSHGAVTRDSVRAVLEDHYTALPGVSLDSASLVIEDLILDYFVSTPERILMCLNTSHRGSATLVNEPDPCLELVASRAAAHYGGISSAECLEKSVVGIMFQHLTPLFYERNPGDPNCINPLDDPNSVTVRWHPGEAIQRYDFLAVFTNFFGHVADKYPDVINPDRLIGRLMSPEIIPYIRLVDASYNRFGFKRKGCNGAEQHPLRAAFRSYERSAEFGTVPPIELVITASCHDLPEDEYKYARIQGLSVGTRKDNPAFQQLKSLSETMGLPNVLTYIDLVTNIACNADRIVTEDDRIIFRNRWASKPNYLQTRCPSHMFPDNPTDCSPQLLASFDQVSDKDEYIIYRRYIRRMLDWSVARFYDSRSDPVNQLCDYMIPPTAKLLDEDDNTATGKEEDLPHIIGRLEKNRITIQEIMYALSELGSDEDSFLEGAGIFGRTLYRVLVHSYDLAANSALRFAPRGDEKIFGLGHTTFDSYHCTAYADWFETAALYLNCDMHAFNIISQKYPEIKLPHRVIWND